MSKSCLNGFIMDKTRSDIFEEKIFIETNVNIMRNQKLNVHYKSIKKSILSLFWTPRSPPPSTTHPPPQSLTPFKIVHIVAVQIFNSSLCILFLNTTSWRYTCSMYRFSMGFIWNNGTKIERFSSFSDTSGFLFLNNVHLGRRLSSRRWQVRLL